jgi:tetratricopeptide (TPR) repeat protein
MVVLLPLGRVNDAVDLLARARAVAPTSLDVRRALAHAQVDAGLYDEAIVNAEWVLLRDPDFPSAKISLGRALVLSRRPDLALPIFSRDPDLWMYLGYLYAVTGRRDEAEALVAEHPKAPIRQMLIYAGLGDKERAFEALNRAVTMKLNPWRAAAWMNRPELAILRGDPRFQVIRQRLGLPE